MAEYNYDTEGDPTVVIVRRPDVENDAHIFGHVRVIDIDLGAGFDELGPASTNDVNEWADSVLAELRCDAFDDEEQEKSVDHVILQVVEDTLGQLAEQGGQLGWKIKACEECGVPARHYHAERHKDSLRRTIPTGAVRRLDDSSEDHVCPDLATADVAR